MKYTAKQWEDLANKVALYEQLEADIEKAKIDIRQMTNKEIANKYVNITRSSNTTTTYPQAYKTELNEVKARLNKKYENEIVVTTKENYSIKLTAMKQAQTQANMIANEVVHISCTKLKKMLANQVK